MQLIREPKKQKEIQVGDVVVLGNSPYIIMKNLFGKHTYSAMCFSGDCYANGEWETLEGLVEDLRKYGSGIDAHYSREEYVLKLVKK